jgi:uncharacterized membrane protein
MKKFVVTAAVGGMLFLVPLVFVVLIVGKAFQVMTRLAEPISKLLPVDHIAGIGLINVVAVLLLLLICVMAGLFAKGPLAQSFYKKLDGLLAQLVPSYIWTRTVARNLAGDVDTEQFKPVLVTLDDQLLLAFEMERSPDGLVVVFMPGAPDVHSGTVAYVTADRVQPLATSLLEINRTLKHMGKGAAALLPAKP